MCKIYLKTVSEFLRELVNDNDDTVQRICSFFDHYKIIIAQRNTPFIP